jgi:hypothetical protein
MFTMHGTEPEGPIESYKTAEAAIKDLFDLWHEDDNDKVFILKDAEGNIHSCIMRGEDPNIATVCRNGGTAQRFHVTYAKHESIIKSLE